MSSTQTSPRNTNRDRWWLPGPPPSRRKVSIEAAEQLYQGDGRAELQVPIRQVDLWSTENRTSPTLRGYFEDKCPNWSNPYCQKSKGPSQREIFLFHSCADSVSPALLQSFSMRGPSIHFARPHGYFSNLPAVYWTNSLDFAFAWAFFTAKGRWASPGRDENFECIVHVSKVDLFSTPAPSGVYMISPPSSLDEEQLLVEWCHTNMTAYSGSKRVPPPLSTQADWSIIGSRIPKHTIDGMNQVTLQELPALGRIKLESTWMYAACDEVSSAALSEAAVEILHIVSNRNSRKASLANL